MRTKGRPKSTNIIDMRNANGIQKAGNDIRNFGDEITAAVNDMFRKPAVITRKATPQPRGK